MADTPKLPDELMDYVPNVHFELIPIRNLTSSQEYQRNISMRHVKEAAAHFDLNQVNPVKVSRREGTNYVFNGQHTIEIIALVSGSRDTPVWCMVYDDLEYAHEADIFANQMKYVKTLLPYEIFAANIEAGNTKQLIIRDLVEDLGMHIAPNAAPGNICAVSTLESIYDKYGLNNLQRTLMLSIATWEGVPQSLSANMLNAIARLIYVYGEDLSDERFKEKLSNISAKEISRVARDRRNGHLGYAEAILIEYNRKSHNCLPWDKLYSHKAPTKKRPKSPDEPTVLPDPGILGLEPEDNSEALTEGETGADTEREALPLEMGYADDLWEGAEA